MSLEGFASCYIITVVAVVDGNWTLPKYMSSAKTGWPCVSLL